MKLVIFDIDGTVADSVKLDDTCFIQSFRDLFDVDLSNIDWTFFKNVTDSGLTLEIFETYLGRSPKKNEVEKLKTHFYDLLYRSKAQIKEVKGAVKTLMTINQHVGFSIAFATGGWRETALLKLASIGLETNGMVLASANEYISRTEIINSAIRQSISQNGIDDFQSITYIGDGLWDYVATKKLGIDFIGVDYHNNGKLIQAGATKVVETLELKTLTSLFPSLKYT